MPRLGRWHRVAVRRCGPGQLEARPQASCTPTGRESSRSYAWCGRQACFARPGPLPGSVSVGRSHGRFRRDSPAGGPLLPARPTSLRPRPATRARPRGFSRLCFAVHLPHAGLHHLHQKERHGGRLGVRGRSLHHEAHFPLGAARRVPHPEFRLTPWPAGPVSHRRVRRHFSGPLKGQEGTDDGFLSFEISHFNLFPHKLTRMVLFKLFLKDSKKSKFFKNERILRCFLFLCRGKRLCKSARHVTGKLGTLT